jgi:hypothetical protein
MTTPHQVDQRSPLLPLAYWFVGLMLAVSSPPAHATAAAATAAVGQEELEQAAMAEAISAPIMGADGEDRSDPAPRSESGAGRRDTVRSHAASTARRRSTAGGKTAAGQGGPRRGQRWRGGRAVCHVPALLSGPVGAGLGLVALLLAGSVPLPPRMELSGWHRTGDRTAVVDMVALLGLMCGFATAGAAVAMFVLGGALQLPSRQPGLLWPSLQRQGVGYLVGLAPLLLVVVTLLQPVAGWLAMRSAQSGYGGCDAPVVLWSVLLVVCGGHVCRLGVGASWLAYCRTQPSSNAGADVMQAVRWVWASGLRPFLMRAFVHAMLVAVIAAVALRPVGIGFGPSTARYWARYG